MLVANKLGRVVTYHERLLLTKSLDRLITLSCEILRQTENIPQPKCLCPPNLAVW